MHVWTTSYFMSPLPWKKTRINCFADKDPGMPLWSNGTKRQRMEISHLPPSASSAAIMYSMHRLNHKFHLFDISVKVFKALVTGKKVKLMPSSTACEKTRVVFNRRNKFEHGGEKIN